MPEKILKILKILETILNLLKKTDNFCRLKGVERDSFHELLATHLVAYYHNHRKIQINRMICIKIFLVRRWFSSEGRDAYPRERTGCVIETYYYRNVNIIVFPWFSISIAGKMFRGKIAFSQREIVEFCCLQKQFDLLTSCASNWFADHNEWPNHIQ